MIKQQPLQIVKEKYGDKGKLVSELAGKLDRDKNESKADFTKRLSKVPSKKLMKLAEMVEKVEGLGGRSGLISALHDNHVRSMTKKSDFKKDAGYITYLEKKSTGELLDSYVVMQKKARAKV